MLPSLKILKKALDYSRGLNFFFVCLNAGDKTYYTFLNLKVLITSHSLKAFKHRYCKIENPTISNI